jgi:pimeloyl-ACP methyl ester carboxylesterase
MSKIKAGNLELEYYSEGSGPPLLMIRGFGSSAAAWGNEFLEGLRPHFTCIRFSNRGTGQSDAGEGTTTIRMMADDTANLMSAFGIERAHIFGVSMGGMIAQEFALAYPAKVVGLVLGCTTPGGPNAATTAQDVLAAITPVPGSSREEQLRAAWPAMCTPGFIAERREFLEEMLREATVHPTPLETIQKQMAAIREFDAYDRLGRIAAPTLVVHGDSDVLIPPANGLLLHEGISGSEMVTIPDAGHMFWWEKPDISARAIVEFLSRVPATA